MAGLGYKVFTAGEVLTAANVNGYLMQGVLVFDDATARTAAIGTPTEGMVAYLKDTNAVEKYTGAAWENVQAAGAGFTSSTATAYTVAGSDAGNILQFTAAATVTVGTATAFTAGQQVQILADGTALTIAGDGNVTLAGAGTAGTGVSFTVGNQYEAVAIVGVGSDAYRIIGNVTGA